jgi:hypothetical protein
MTEKLFIIGNGFDLHHKMPTSYMDFRENYLKNKPLWEVLLKIYGDSPKQDFWWWNFEKMLGCVDYNNIVKLMNGEALGFMQVKNLLKGKLPPLFGNWIQGVNDKVEPDETIGIDADAKFFTFNYTMVLEKTYHVNEENVWHIHHSIKDFKEGKNPIVGHDFNNVDLMQLLIEAKKKNPIRQDVANMIMNEVANAAKKVNDIIYMNRIKFTQYADIQHFVVMGFSFNDIDMPYIKEIIKANKNIPDADWLLYYHQDGEDEMMINKLLKLGITKNKILPPKGW